PLRDGPDRAGGVGPREPRPRHLRETGSLPYTELVQAGSEKRERIGRRYVVRPDRRRAGTMRATRLRPHTGHADAVDRQIEGILAAAGGCQPGIREGAHTGAVEDLQHAVERFAFGAGE